MPPSTQAALRRAALTPHRVVTPRMIQPHNTDPSSTHNPNWYVVLTKPKQELRAQEHLERQGGIAFVPMFANERIIRGQRVVRQEPLFPGYLFLQVDSDNALLSKVRSTLGVRQLLTFAGQVMTIAPSIIADLQQRNTSTELHIPEPFSAGQSVTLEHGPFAHYQALFKEYDGAERGIILLSLLGQQNELVIQLADLRAN